MEIVPAKTVISIPELSAESTAELGETLLAKGHYYSYDGIRTRAKAETGDGFWLKKYSIPPQELAATHEHPWRRFFRANEITMYDSVIGTVRTVGGIYEDVETGELGIWANNFKQLATLPDDFEIERTSVISVREPGFKQELIYNGKVGDQIKFLYREFSQDMIRAAFTQEVQYDLSESDTIGFKGARIRVVEATNSMIRYVVTKSFP